MAPEQEKLLTKDCHGVGIPRHRNVPADMGRDPSHRIEVKDVDIIEALLAVVAAKHVELALDAAHRVAGAGGRLRPIYLRLGPHET